MREETDEREEQEEEKERKGKERERKRRREVEGGVVRICVGIDADGDKFGIDRVRKGLFVSYYGMKIV